MVQILTSHVFFHFLTEVYHIASVLTVLQIFNHGALLRLIKMDITLMRNGEIVKATVKQVILVLFHLWVITIQFSTNLIWFSLVLDFSTLIFEGRNQFGQLQYQQKLKTSNMSPARFRPLHFLADQTATPGSGGATHYYLPHRIFDPWCIPAIF